MYFTSEAGGSSVEICPLKIARPPGLCTNSAVDLPPNCSSVTSVHSSRASLLLKSHRTSCHLNLSIGSGKIVLTAFFMVGCCIKLLIRVKIPPGDAMFAVCFSTESPLCSVDFYTEGLVTTKDKNMAGACSICQALRLNSALRKCLRFRYFPPKLKYAVPAAFLSSAGFLGSQRSTESSISASLLSQSKHLPMCCLGSRSFRTTAFQRERASEESDDKKTGSKKIKAKLEQMKEMVRKNQG